MDIVYGVGGLILGVGTMVLYTLVIGKGAKTKAAEILNEAERSAKDKLKDAETVSYTHLTLPTKA